MILYFFGLPVLLLAGTALCAAGAWPVGIVFFLVVAFLIWLVGWEIHGQRRPG